MNTVPTIGNKRLQKSFILFLLVICISLNSFAQPAISSFSPVSGPVGTSVTVTGTNFSATPASNIVFVGGVKANVTAATTTSLTVTVPAGAMSQPVSVTTNGLTAFSNKPFTVTFSGAAPMFSPQSFVYAGRVDSVNSNTETTKYAIGDIDDDKKIDVITVDRLNNTMSVYRNTTAGGSITFAPKIDFTTGNSPRAVAIADIDGDGKPDVVVTNLQDNAVSLFRNTSNGATVSFAAKVDFATATQPAGIAVTDIDKDGKPDLVINTVNLQGYVSVLRNTGSVGTISFASRIDVQSVGGSIEEIRTADVDGDAMPDIVLPDFAANKIKIFRNTSLAGNISFATAVSFNTSLNPDNIEIGDFNDDGKPDLAVSHYSFNSIHILKNYSTVGNIVFQFGNSYPDGNMYGSAINDLDGDGRSDLAISIGLESVSLFKNNSSSGGDISFGSKGSVQAPFTSHAICGDFDNDGKPDIAFKAGMFRVAIWKNRTTGPQVTYFSPSSGKAGDTITISGFNFTGITAVSFGGAPAASFTIQNGTRISAVLGAGATGDVKVFTNADSGSLSGFTYVGPPAITGFTPSSGASYEKIIIKGQNFVGTTAVKFGGVSATFRVIDAFTIEANIGTGASGDVSVINPYGTATMPGFTYIPRPYITSFTPGTAVKGSTITIKGLNFLGVTSVDFGGMPAASFTIVDDATIQAVVGDGASGNVQVTNSHGMGEKPDLIFYPPPVITSFSPVAAAHGDTVTITGFNFLHRYNNALITSVKFGGYDAYFTIVDSFTIKAKVNYGATGAITIECNRGNASMPGFNFIHPPVISSVYPLITGPGGEVTITGQHFTPATVVKFGDTPASSFTVISADTIKAIVGTGASGFVTIITPKHTVTQGPWVYYTTSPLIYSISPIAGPVGTTVTISGINFQPGIADNVVYFGGVKADILSAAAKTITVTVPAGANYKPVSVVSQTTKLTATSIDRFNVTFPVDTAAFNDSSFAGRMDFATGTNPAFLKHADIDGDGKLDIVFINHGSTFVSVYRNLSVPGRLSFSPRIDVEIGMKASAMTVADMDVDGKPDLIIANGVGAAPKLFVFRNQSTLGNITFVNVYSIDILHWPAGFIETGDFNQDGRLDIVYLCTSCQAPGRINVCRNTGSNGKMSFAEPVTYTYYHPYSMPGTMSGLAITDFNHDDKPDVILGMSMSSALYYFKNTSQPGSFISFDVKHSDEYYSAGHSTATPFTATFRSKEYPDLIAGYFVLKNTAGSYSHGLWNNVLATSVYDLNGDGQQDILGSNVAGSKLSIMKNTGAGNAIAFAPPYTMDMPGGYTEVGDLDGDSKPEICILYQFSNLLTILRNRIGEAAPPKPTISAFSPQTSAYSSQVIIKGNNLEQTTSVTFGGVPALYFTVLSNDSIVATVGNGSSGAVCVTTPGGTDSLDGFTFIPMPVITSFTPKGGKRGAAVTIAGRNFTGATEVSFGSVAASSFTVRSADTIVAYLGDGATGSVRVNTPGGIAKLDTFLYYLPPVIDSITPASATTGRQVVLTGDHFEGVSAVSFGGVAASSFTISPDYKTITAVVGAGATGSVTVVNPAGTYSLPGFTFIHPFSPVISYFTPPTAGTGETVTIKGNYFSGATAVSFGGVAARSFTVVDSTTIHAVVGGGATGNVSVTTQYGTATQNGFTYNSVTAIVDPGNVNSRELTVSPNPAHDLLIIKHPASVKSARLRFINMLGHEVRTIIPARNATQTETSVLGLSKGVYTIVWNEGNRNLSRVFVVQ